MNKKYKLSIIIALACLVLLVSFIIVRGLMDHKQSLDTAINDTTPPKKELLDWQEEYDRKVRTEPADRVATKYGDFYYAPSPKQFPRSEIANLDVDDEVTQHTKQVILKGYYYEKKL